MSKTPTSGDASPEADGEATTEPPTTAPAESSEFEKRVDLLEKDSDEQIARGAVLVPGRLDHQGDFLREDTIARLRENWTERIEARDAYPGVMHAVFPEDAMALVEDRQLDAPETIGSKTLPAGAWVQAWRYDDDQLWSLVDDGVLSGFSIGGTATGTIYEPGTMPEDVEIPEPVQAELDEAGLSRDEIMVREITDGRIMETSTVDQPAVPDATHAETKTDLRKAAPALTENLVAARLYLEERGHDPDDARRLAEFLQTHKQADGGGLLDRAKAWLGKGRGGGAPDPPAAPTEKAGRTLSAANVESAMAVHDAALDMLARSDVEHARQRFTDDEATDFDIGAYGRQESVEDSAGGPPEESDTESTANTHDMTEDELTEALEQFSERLGTIEAQLSAADDESGEETEQKDSADDEGPTTEEKVEALGDVVERQTELLEQMASAQGVSQQADQGQGATGGGEKLWGENSPFGGGD